MTSENLEEKTQEQKRRIAEMDIMLFDICGFDHDKAKRLNPFRKKDYKLTNYNEALRRILW